MSAGITDSDGMFSVRKAPWHGLGVVLVAEAIEASGLGWSVAKERIAVDRGDEPDDDWLLPRWEQIPGYYATVRQDTREVLGIVGERYRIVQNHDAFAFIDQLLGSSIHFETAGSLHGGRVWVLATLPDHVEVGGDAVRPCVLLMNSHDGSTAVIAATTRRSVSSVRTPSTGVSGAHGRSSRSVIQKRSRSASMRLAESSICRSITTSSSSATATSSPQSVARSVSFARSSTSSTRTARATRSAAARGSLGSRRRTASPRCSCVARRRATRPAPSELP
jgi:phage/plasmid-like protein (TIGR03299 family)